MAREERRRRAFFYMKNIIKPVLPSLREKKRYIAYEVLTEGRINDNVAKNAVSSYILKFLGELGYAKAGIIMLNHENNKGIIRVGHNHVNEAKTALALIDDIDNNNVNVRSITVSGSLSKALSKMEVN